MNKTPCSILVATNHLETLGGSETYTYALAEELKNQRFKVDYFTFQKGTVSDQLEKKLNVQFMQQKKIRPYTCQSLYLCQSPAQTGFCSSNLPWYLSGTGTAFTPCSWICSHISRSKRVSEKKEPGKQSHSKRDQYRPIQKYQAVA